MSALASALAAFADKLPSKLEGSAVADDDEDDEGSAIASSPGMWFKFDFLLFYFYLFLLQISLRHLQSRLRRVPPLALRFLQVHASPNLFFGSSQSCARRAETST